MAENVVWKPAVGKNNELYTQKNNIHFSNVGTILEHRKHLDSLSLFQQERLNAIEIWKLELCLPKSQRTKFPIFSF